MSELHIEELRRTHQVTCDKCEQMICVLEGRVDKWQALAGEALEVLDLSKDVYSDNGKESIERFHAFEKLRDRFLTKAREAGL